MTFIDKTVDKKGYAMYFNISSSSSSSLKHNKKIII